MTKYLRYFISPLFLAVAVYLICQIQVLFVFPSVLDDEFYFAYQSHLILSGFVPYRDFFLHTSPASYYIVAFFYKIFGEYIAIERILAVILFLITLIVCYKLFPLRSYWRYLYLLALAVLFVSPGSSLFNGDGAIIAFIALYVCLKAIEKNSLKLLIVSGILSGLSFLFIQSMGLVFLAIVTGLFLRYSGSMRWRAISMYALGESIIILPVCLYFFSVHAFSQAFYYIFLYAGTVKNFETPFLLHRLVGISVIIGIFVLSRKINRRNKIILFSASIIFGIIYFLNERYFFLMKSIRQKLTFRHQLDEI